MRTAPSRMRRASALLLLGGCLAAGCASPRGTFPRTAGTAAPSAAIPPPSRPATSPSNRSPRTLSRGDRSVRFASEDVPGFIDEDDRLDPATPPARRPPGDRPGTRQRAAPTATRDSSAKSRDLKLARRPSKADDDEDDDDEDEDEDDDDEEDPPPMPRRDAGDRAGPGARRGPKAKVEDEDIDLSRPRAQREGGGGGPTRAEEEEDEEQDYVQPNLLNRLLGLEDDGPVRVFGWAEGSFTANPTRPADGQNFGLTPNNLANKPAFQQLYLVAEKRVKQGDKLDFGFRLDNLIGNDWQNFHDVGLFDRLFTPDQVGYDPVQFYGEVHLPYLGGIDVKGGRFFALAGYEEAMAPSRPLLSTSDMFSFGSHPFTHFGMMTTWHVTDRINFYNGAVNGWNRWINRHYIWNYAGGVSIDSKDERTNLTITLNYGPEQFPTFLPADYPTEVSGVSPLGFQAGRRNFGYGTSQTTLFTTVLIHEWTEDFTTVLEADQGRATNVPGLGRGGTSQTASWYGLAGWFLYEFTDHTTGVFRAEVFRDNNGVLIRDADNFYEMTLGAIYKPKLWLWFRPEVRYDWAQFTHPYNDGTSKHQFTFGFDVILLF